LDLIDFERSSSDSVPTWIIPMSACLSPLRHISRATAVSANETGSSSQSGPQNSRMRSPTLYLPGVPCAFSSSVAEHACRGVYTSSA